MTKIIVSEFSSNARKVVEAVLQKGRFMREEGKALIDNVLDKHLLSSKTDDIM